LGLPAAEPKLRGRRPARYRTPRKACAVNHERATRADRVEQSAPNLGNNHNKTIAASSSGHNLLQGPQPSDTLANTAHQSDNHNLANRKMPKLGQSQQPLRPRGYS
jgi:hypothetical protein